MKIPYQQISPEALQALVEDFVTRNGTDYGTEEISLAEKTQQVMRQLENGEAVIVYDPVLESGNITLAAYAQEYETNATTEEI